MQPRWSVMQQQEVIAVMKTLAEGQELQVPYVVWLVFL